MSAVWFRARAELRARWRAWLTLAVLLGLAGGVAITAAGGARRTYTAFDRLRTVTKAQTLTLQENGESDPKLLDKIESLPQVAASGRLAMIPADVVSGGGFAWSIGAGAFANPEIGTGVAVPLVRDGRKPNQADPHEAMASPDFMRTRGLRVGDSFSIRTVTFDELFQLFDGVSPKPTGPTITVRIVGTGLLPDDVGFAQENKGFIYFTRAFYETYRDKIAALEVLTVRLRHGERDLAAFSEAAGRLAGGPERIGITSETRGIAQVHDALQTQSTALWIFSMIVGLAALLLIGQAIARTVSLGSDDNAIHSALGTTRGALVASALLPVVLCAVAGATIAILTSIPGSAAMPVGFARALEPSRGIRVDASAIAVGGGAIVVVVCALGTFAGIWATRRHASDQRLSPSVVAANLARAGASPAMVSGSRFAFEPGRGRHAVPTRGVLVGVIAGIVAMTAAVSFDASFHHLLARPSAYGFNWDAIVAGGEDPTFTHDRASRLAASPLVSSYALVDTRTIPYRGTDLTAAAVTPGKGEIGYRVVEGRLPNGPGEAALGSITLQQASLKIGQDVSFLGAPGLCAKTVETCRASFRVTGRVVFWEEDGRPGVGALFTPDGLERLVSTNGFVDVAVRLAPGTTVEQFRSALGLGAGELIANRSPAEVQNLGRARSVTRAVTAILAVIALATMAIALFTSVARRRRDLAILKVLGFVRAQVGRTVAWQATLLIAVALGVGVPLGVIGGRWLWTRVANRIGVAVEPEVPILALTAGALALIALANVVALGPGRSAAHTRPALVLRSE